MRLLGYFILDNISLNDVCVNKILYKLCSDLNKKDKQLKCIGHIINLATQVFLFGKDPKAFEVEAVVVRDAQLEQRELDI